MGGKGQEKRRREGMGGKEKVSGWRKEKKERGESERNREREKL